MQIFANAEEMGWGYPKENTTASRQARVGSAVWCELSASLKQTPNISI